jgi:hypothetical protein
MRFAPWTSLAVAAAVLASPLALAQTLQTPAAPESSANRPGRGMTMEKVEAAFGAPSNRVPAVGQPPITRWEYPGFVVYFEHRVVLHTVVTG